MLEVRPGGRRDGGNRRHAYPAAGEECFNILLAEQEFAADAVMADLAGCGKLVQLRDTNAQPLRRRFHREIGRFGKHVRCLFLRTRAACCGALAKRPSS